MLNTGGDTSTYKKTVRLNPKLNTSAAPSVLYSTQPIGTVFNTAHRYCMQTPKIGAVCRHQRSVLYADTKDRCCIQTPKIGTVYRHQRLVLYTDTKDRYCIQTPDSQPCPKTPQCNDLRVVVVDIQYGDVERGLGDVDAVRNPDDTGDEASRLSIQWSSGEHRVAVNCQCSRRRHADQAVDQAGGWGVVVEGLQLVEGQEGGGKKGGWGGERRGGGHVTANTTITLIIVIAKQDFQLDVLAASIIFD